MKILTRYIIREHLGPLLFALSALTALLLLNQIAKQFGALVGKGLGWGVIGEFFYLSIPFIIAMTLPMAVLVAVLYAFSRMAAENEVTALRASGVSVVRLVRPVMVGGAVLALIMLFFNDQILPRANHRLRTLQTDIARKKPTFALREQMINEVIPGKIFLKTGHIDEATNRMREVFIYNFEDPTHRKTIYADSGQMGLTADQSTLQLTLHHGYVLEVPRDEPATLQRLYFTTDLVRVHGVANKFEKTETDSYKSEREMTICEMNAQYQDGVHQLQVARHDLATLLANAARYAATGENFADALPKPITPRDRPTSGRFYCDFISKVFSGIPTAEAAEVPPTSQQQPQGTKGKQAPQKPLTPQQRALLERLQLGRKDSAHQRIVPPPSSLDTAKLRKGLAAMMAASTPRYSLLQATLGQVEVTSARITDAKYTMARYQVEIQKKFALAAACIVFVLFGAPIALYFPRGGVGLVLGVSLVAFALYYICLIAGETLSNRFVLSPFWAMWMANIIFTIIGVVLLIRVQRSGATARGGGLGEGWERLRLWLARRARFIGIPADRRQRATT